MDRQLLGQWLKAGFLEKHAWFATTEGTPQGGIISPVLANWTLDGLQRLLAEHFAEKPGRQRKFKVHLVRYADDFLITGISKELLRDQVQPLVAHFLKERGLELSHEKTQITHVEEGFDFLGQNVRRYRCGKVFTKPSSRNVKTFLTKIQETIDRSRSLTAGAMIRRLNQQIKGWTMYHRYAASKRTFTYVDHRIFQMLWRWCRRRHQNKSRKWIKEKYFQQDGRKYSVNPSPALAFSRSGGYSRPSWTTDQPPRSVSRPCGSQSRNWHPSPLVRHRIPRHRNPFAPPRLSPSAPVRFARG